MNTAVRLVAHSIAFAVLVGLLRPTTVAPAALLSVFALGFIFLLLGPAHRRYPRSPSVWLKVLLYAFLLAGLFFGADFAMQALGTSVKPRAPLPSAFGGLELYWFLAPGVTSVAAGALAGSFLEQRGQAQG